MEHSKDIVILKRIHINLKILYLKKHYAYGIETWHKYMLMLCISTKKIKKNKKICIYLLFDLIWNHPYYVIFLIGPFYIFLYHLIYKLSIARVLEGLCTSSWHFQKIESRKNFFAVNYSLKNNIQVIWFENSQYFWSYSSLIDIAHR